MAPAEHAAYPVTIYTGLKSPSCSMADCGVFSASLRDACILVANFAKGNFRSAACRKQAALLSNLDTFLENVSNYAPGAPEELRSGRDRILSSLRRIGHVTALK